jgi:hypothetical protein
MCCENVEFWKWEVEAVSDILTRAVALDGAKEAVMAPFVIIFTIIGTSE